MCSYNGQYIAYITNHDLTDIIDMGFDPIYIILLENNFIMINLRRF